jgi:hypothetical protein
LRAIAQKKKKKGLHALTQTSNNEDSRLLVGHGEGGVDKISNVVEPFF